MYVIAVVTFARCNLVGLIQKKIMLWGPHAIWVLAAYQLFYQHSYYDIN